MRLPSFSTDKLDRIIMATCVSLVAAVNFVINHPIEYRPFTLPNIAGNTGSINEAQNKKGRVSDRFFDQIPALYMSLRH